MKLFELAEEHHAGLLPLFQPMEMHLAPQAALAGHSTGRVWVDTRRSPSTALLQRGDRYYLYGDPGVEGISGRLEALFLEQVFPQMQQAGRGGLPLFYEPPGWEAPLRALFEARYPVHSLRHYYELEILPDAAPTASASAFDIRPIDEALLAQAHLENMDDLIEEIHSEAPSLEHFLEHCFGFVALDGETIAGMCLSEYNLPGRCEVGIITLPKYRRRGIAAALAGALVRRAWEQGVERIGWHCYATNRASIATALKTGFRKVCEYPVLDVYLDPMIGLAVNGNLQFEYERYEQALEWYARAFEAGDAPAWVYTNAASAHALLGEEGPAFERLRQARKLGFRNLEYLENSPHLASLRAAPGWQGFVEEFG